MDDLDSSLLSVLEKEPRISNSELGRRLNVSESYIRQRLKRLFDSGRYRRGLVVDFAVLGISTVAGLKIRFAAYAMNTALERLAEEPCAGLVMSVLGAFNVYMIAALRGPIDLANFLDDRVRPMEGFLDMEVTLIAEAVKYDARQVPLRLI